MKFHVWIIIRRIRWNFDGIQLNNMGPGKTQEYGQFTWNGKLIIKMLINQMFSFILNWIFHPISAIQHGSIVFIKIICPFSITYFAMLFSSSFYFVLLSQVFSKSLTLYVPLAKSCQNNFSCLRSTFERTGDETRYHKKKSNNATRNFEQIFCVCSFCWFVPTIIKVETLKMIMHTQYFSSGNLWWNEEKVEKFPNQSRKRGNNNNKNSKKIS